MLIRHSGERIHAVPDRVHADDESDCEQRRPRDVAQEPAPRLREQPLPARRRAPLQRKPARCHETRAALPQERLPPAIARVAGDPRQRRQFMRSQNRLQSASSVRLTVPVLGIALL